MTEQQLKEWFSAAELAGLPGMPGTERAIQISAKKNGWQSRPRAGRGGGREYHISALPPNTQAALLKKHSFTSAPISSLSASEFSSAASVAEGFSYDPEALWNLAGRRSQVLRDEGARRSKLLQQVMHLVNTGHTFGKAATAVGGAHGVPAANLRNWYHGVNGRPGAKNYAVCDWAAALIPGYTGRTAGAECSPEAWDYYKADFLRLEQPAAAACYERLARIAAERGWQVPSLPTLDRRLQRELSPQAIVLAREGTEALQRLYPAQSRDRSVLQALEAVNADGHKFDVFVRWPDGTIGRPLMVAWQDIFSGKMLSYRVDRTEHADSVRLSFGDLVEKFGLPQSTYLDNGRAFASKWMTGGTPTRYRFKVKDEDPAGILTMLGVTVHWATPYHGQAKPIERAFRDLCEYVAKHPAFAGAYTGNKPDAKPEDYGSKAIPLTEFLAVLDQEINAHNARVGRRGGVCAGRSFDEVFAESYSRSEIRRATAEQRRLWLLAADGVRAGVNGEIVLETDKRNRYWCEALARHAGEKLVARFDPQRLHESVHVYRLDGTYIAEAQCHHAAGFNDSQTGREHSRARNQFKRAAREQLVAERRMTAIEAAGLLPESAPPPPPETKVVRAMFGDQIKKVANGGTVGVGAETQSQENRDQHFARAVSDLQEQLRKNAL
ncbi:MAG TPA: transposase domain-containing protein [Acidiferrobacterales bacterium]|nr:transposase domain-containing protein [Acidiferrobacterales bacterium]